VREGTRLGTLAASREHAGLHLGVRRAGHRFAYVDPVPLLAPGHRPPGIVAAPREGPAGDRRVSPPPARVSVPRLGPPPGRVSAPRLAPPPARVSAPRLAPAVRVPSGRPLAPWPVWLGLALVLCGAAGGGIRVRVRRRHAAREAVASAP
jgi:hypothetical protein